VAPGLADLHRTQERRGRSQVNRRKRAFERGLQSLLSAHDINPLPGPRGPDGTMVFWARHGTLTLLLGVVYHRFFDEALTVDFFLGRTYTFNLITPDYPRTAAPRIFELIGRPPISQAGPGWWFGYDGTTATDVAAAIVASLPEYRGREGIVERVERLAAHRTRWELASEVILAIAPPPPDPDARVNPPRSGPPSVWLEAADAVLKRRGEPRLSPERAAKTLALDAWRMWLTGHPALASIPDVTSPPG